MNNSNPNSGNDICLSKARVGAYLSRLQDEATKLESILEGIAILFAEDKGGNACVTLIGLALEKANYLKNALDSVEWPKRVAA